MSDMYQDFLTQMANGDAEFMPELPDSQALLAQLSAENPQLAAVIRFITMRQQSAATGDDEIVWDDEMILSDGSQSHDESENEISHLLRDIYAELEELQLRNDSLAAALGACYLCWGEDFECPDCGGHGRPGASQPDQALFASWIVPAIRRIRSKPPTQDE